MTEPSPDPSPAQVQEQILHDHHRVYAAVRQIEYARELRELLQSIQQLRVLIRAHFLDEEAPGGFFEVIRERSARHLAAVDGLARDHQAFLADLDKLTERALDCLAGPVAEVLKQGAQLARRMQEHEKRENRILMDAMYEESGQSE